jgi:hypothetical protein
MERLTLPAISERLASQDSRLGSNTVIQSARPTVPLPKISNPLTDIEIPRSVWSTWREAGKPRQLRRALTSDEIRAIEARRDELAPFVGPFAGAEETKRVSVALARMFGSFSQMRQTGEEAAAVVMATRELLEEFPAWAIEKACMSIRTNGVWRDGKFDRVWPPSESEIVADVRKEVRLYGDQHRSAVALLGATVEQPR